MDIEQLKLILETVQAVSGQAQSVAIWWVVISQALPAVLWFIFGITFVLGMYCTVRLYYGVAQQTRQLDKLRRLGQQYCFGYLRGDSVEEIDHALEIITERLNSMHTPKN